MAVVGMSCVVVGVAVLQSSHGGVVETGGGRCCRGVVDEKGGRWWRWDCRSIVGGATSAGWQSSSGRAAALLGWHC